jgi:hypothetical protein
VVARAHTRWGEIDHRSSKRPWQSAGEEGGTYAIARLTYCGGQSDDGEPGQAVGDVDLDGHRAADGSGQCRGRDDGVLHRSERSQRSDRVPQMPQTWIWRRRLPHSTRGMSGSSGLRDSNGLNLQSRAVSVSTH